MVLTTRQYDLCCTLTLLLGIAVNDVTGCQGNKWFDSPKICEYDYSLGSPAFNVAGLRNDTLVLK